jgi:lipopolysaccharide-binding protein
MRGSALVLALALVCLASLSTATLPAFKTSLTQGGLTEIKDVTLPLLIAEIGEIAIPDISGETGTPIGTIQYWLTNIRLNGLAVSGSALQLVPGVGLAVDLSGLSAHVHLDWKYREEAWPHIQDSGSADVSISQSTVAVSMAVTEVNGEPHLAVTSTVVSLNQLDISLHGGASWLYNLFTGIFSGQIKNAAQSALHDEITNIVNTQANKALASLPMEEKVGGGQSASIIDFAQVTQPVFTSAYLTTSHKGEFYSPTNPKEAPFTPGNLPDTPPDSSLMLGVLVDEYLINTATYVQYQDGVLQYVVTNADLPSDFPMKLNTTNFRLICPPLYQHYPNLNMELAVEAVAPPVATITSENIQLVFSGTIGVDVVLANGSVVNAFMLSALADAKLDVAVLQQNLTGKLSLLHSNFSLESTNIGPVNVTVLNTIVNALTTSVLIPLLNKLIGGGFPIPTVDGITFISPQVTLMSGYFTMETNFTYKPNFLTRAEEAVLAREMVLTRAEMAEETSEGDVHALFDADAEAKAEAEAAQAALEPVTKLPVKLSSRA